MSRLLAKFGNFFWSPTLHRILIAIVILIVLVYTEEDWRGAHNWAVTKAKWEAQGESFDRKKFVPPPVADDQNIAALPLFKLEMLHILDEPGYLTAVTFHHATHDDLHLENVATGNWSLGKLPDMAAVRKVMTANFAVAVKGTQPPDDLLAQLNAIYPFLADFLADAAKRSSFRINSDYLFTPPAGRPLGPLTDSIKLAKILTLHAMLSLDQHQRDVALQDIKTNLTLVKGVGRDPTLVGGLVALGVAAIGHGALYDGLAQHAWNDAELDDLEKTLESVDFLSIYQSSMRGEASASIANLEFFQRSSRSELAQIFGRGVYESPVANLSGIPWPSGWWDENKCQIADLELKLVTTVDPKTHVFDRNLAVELKAQAGQAEKKWDALAPWNILAVTIAGPMANGAEKFAEGQVAIDEMRIACGLERYHLAHNTYPALLDELAPAYLDAVPPDPMSGKSYLYQLRNDGTFLLYSVGWNQTDDGGTIVFAKDNPKAIDYENGDWVWPTPKLPH